MRRQLFALFAVDGKEPCVDRGLLLVAAPLQEFEGEFGKQVWFEPKVTPLVDALLACMAIPGLFAPIEAKPGWIAGMKEKQPLDLIDGALVRQNPLPALFRWLKRNATAAGDLRGHDVTDFSVHLVYGVPIRPGGDSVPKRRESVDLVDAASIGINLARRRDSRMEVRQTNFISELALHVQAAHLEKQDGIHAILADEIAPDREIEFDNNLAPQREEMLRVAAGGCRATLETLHRHALTEFGYQPVPCEKFLKQQPTGRADFIQISSPGLPEVCQRCTKMLWAPPDPVKEAQTVEERWFSRLPLEKYSHLTPDDGSTEKPSPHQPRIVFLAAGGVFRGAFHIGVIGAMQAARMKPDLIIGASVGTLMGGALGAISTLNEQESRDRLLGELCLTFLEVDERVALTKVLKNAAKQLGTRGRAIDLSPADMRRAVRRGTRSDPGFAVAGAPSILIDAISTLFLIPHKDTQDIAAKFVAGRITEALKLFWIKARVETLQRLDIRTAVIGTSLLEERAQLLLGAQPFDKDGEIDLTRDQPYPGISFFATASDLSCNRPLLLPRDLEDSTVYDFVQAALSSSAFPAAFHPRQQAEVQPGRGATDVLYADGGMFDNLPFFPAIEILSILQRSWRRERKKNQVEEIDAHRYLEQRLERPDLFLAASLEGEIEKKKKGKTDRLGSFLDIYQRAGKLNVNTKLDSFLGNAKVIARDGALLQRAANPTARAQEFMDGLVNAAVLKVTPSDKDHLNGTFAFSRSVGFGAKVVAKSIADGCFRTLGSLIDAKDLAKQAVKELKSEGRISELKVNRGHRPDLEDGCPFFLRIDDGKPQPFACPFARAANEAESPNRKTIEMIYVQCQRDKKHLMAIK